MFWADIVLATRQVEKYGLQHPIAELGVGAAPCIADYDLTIQTGDQSARYLTLRQRPFDHLSPEYNSLSLDACASNLENLALKCSNSLGTLLCFEVLQSVPDPYLTLRNLYAALRPGSLLVLGSLFAYPFGVEQHDMVVNLKTAINPWQ